MSDEHFTVDGTLIQAWASQKSYHPKGGSDDGDGTNFHGQKRSNEPHQSTTDPDSRSYKKSYGKESKLSYLGHALVENRNGLIAAAMVTHADGQAERDAALLMLDQKQKVRSRRITVGADKAYDTRDFVIAARALDVAPHGTENNNGRRSSLNRRTTRHPGYALSLSRRWLVEKGFGWLKQTGPLRQVKLRGLAKVDWLFVSSCAAHNLIRLPKLLAQQDTESSAAVRLNAGCVFKTALLIPLLHSRNTRYHTIRTSTHHRAPAGKLFQQAPRSCASSPFVKPYIATLTKSWRCPASPSRFVRTRLRRKGLSWIGSAPREGYNVWAATDCVSPVEAIRQSVNMHQALQALRPESRSRWIRHTDASGVQFRTADV